MRFWQIIGQWVLPILSIISAVVCVCVLCKVAPRQVVGFDYMGVIVAIFALLVTSLLGWQIYNAIEFKKEVLEVKDAKKTIIYESERSAIYTFMGLSEYYGAEINVRPINEDKFYRYIFFNLSVILHASRINDNKTCCAYIKALVETITEDATLLRDRDKNDLIAMLNMIPNSDNLFNFKELYTKIKDIKIKS